jgi:hypothetical protein
VAGDPTPLSENELLSRLPSSNRPGALRREHLPPTERVLFETRPSLVALYWGRLLFLGLYLGFFLAVGASAPFVAGPGALLVAIPGFVWLGVIYLQWTHRVYALTDQRVIQISGIRGTDFQDATYAQVQNLSRTSEGIVFDTTPPPTATELRVRPSHLKLRWEGISDAPRVYAFVQEAFTLGLRRQQLLAAAREAVNRISESSVRCAYCGGPIDLARLDPANTRCPRCSAPVNLPR